MNTDEYRARRRKLIEEQRTMKLTKHGSLVHTIIPTSCNHPLGMQYRPCGRGRDCPHYPIAPPYKPGTSMLSSRHMPED